MPCKYSIFISTQLYRLVTNFDKRLWTGVSSDECLMSSSENVVGEAESTEKCNCVENHGV